MAADSDAPSTTVLDLALEAQSDADGHDGEDDSASRAIIGQCTSCGSDIGEFFNSWIKGTGSYYFPAMAGSYHLVSERMGKPNLAKATSSLQDCTIQALKCSNPNCSENVGLYCLRAPESKSAYVDRHLFKLSKIQLKSEKTGQPVPPIIEDRNAYSEGTPAPARLSMDSTGEPLASSRPESGPKTSAESSVAPPQGQYGPTCHTAPESIGNASEYVTGSSYNPRASTNGPTAAGPNGVSRQDVNSDHIDTMTGAKLEPIDRLQTQVNLNRATLEMQTREMRSLSEAFAAMQNEMRRMGDNIEALRRELYMRPTAGPREVPDETLESFSHQLQGVIRKANEVDELKVQLELLKRKVHRATTVESSPGTGHPYSAQRETPFQGPPVSNHVTPPTIPHLALPRPSQPHLRADGAPYLPEITPRPIDTLIPSSGAAAGWTSVNTNAKRTYANGVDAHGDPDGTAKRQKLAPAESPYPREILPSQHPRPERMETDPSFHPPQLQSHDSYPDSTTSLNFVPYPEAHRADPDDSWRSDSRTSPRGRGRGRPGRPRKSLPHETHRLDTPEGEKETWAGAEIGPDGSYHPTTPTFSTRGGIVRRGSGGAAAGNRVPIPPPSSQQSPINIMDSYAHTKKARTKPTRNADGILIRKDGRPDMRSQSSAANLRKVHARKEEERRLEAEGLKTRLSTESSPMTPGSHNTDGQNNAEDGEEHAPNTQERTDTILQRMFPHGVEEQREKLASAETYFPNGGKENADKPSDSESRAVSEARKEVVTETNPAEVKPEEQVTAEAAA